MVPAESVRYDPHVSEQACGIAAPALHTCPRLGDNSTNDDQDIMGAD